LKSLDKLKFSAELDKKLLELQHKHNQLNSRYAEIEGEIEHLESKKFELEAEINKIELQIEAIKEQLLEIEMNKINAFIDDQFTNDFIRASYFALRNEETTRPVLKHVNITEFELMATDLYRGIIIRCSCIPTELKNSKIKWDVREDFAANINRDLGNFPDLKAVIDETKKNSKIIFRDVEPNEFYSKFEPADHPRALRLRYSDENDLITLNKYYLDISLKCLEGQTFYVYITDRNSPIVMESDDTSIIIMPMY
jgi:vacuolar-type H+-ATPase subunit I/STV1